MGPWVNNFLYEIESPSNLFIVIVKYMKNRLSPFNFNMIFNNMNFQDLITLTI